MKRSTLLFSIIALANTAWGCGSHKPATAITPVSVKFTAATRPPLDPQALNHTIANYETSLHAHPKQAIILAMLAGAYAQRCRETGDIADAVRAEQAARRSLAVRTKRNDQGRDQLALSLFTQHRFSEAQTVADQTCASNPDDPQAQALQIEIHTERGDYAQALIELRALEAQGVSAGSYTLHARLYELTGQTEEALKLMRKAQDLADRNYDMPRENVAWYHMRVGDMLAALGRAAEAETAYKDALAYFPTDYRTLLALTRLACGRSQWTEATQWGEKAAAVVPTPQVAALLGDAYSALGRKREAEDQYRLVEAIAKLARAQGAIYDRDRALFCADHGRNPSEALALARKELTVRHDVYAYDTLAWACCQNRLLNEAQTNMQKALAVGTQDSRLFYHAGVIAERRGDHAQAKDYLSKALKINPYFQPFAPDRARALLARL